VVRMTEVIVKSTPKRKHLPQAGCPRGVPQSRHRAGLVEGLDPKARKAATDRIQTDLEVARKALAQIERWHSQAEADARHAERVRQLAERFERKLMTNWADPDPELMQWLFAELGIRVDVLSFEPLRVRISDNVVWSSLAAWLARGGWRAWFTCARDSTWGPPGTSTRPRRRG
jgi:hypothetical protein